MLGRCLIAATILLAVVALSTAQPDDLPKPISKVSWLLGGAYYYDNLDTNFYEKLFYRIGTYNSHWKVMKGFFNFSYLKDVHENLESLKHEYRGSIPKLEQAERIWFKLQQTYPEKVSEFLESRKPDDMETLDSLAQLCLKRDGTVDMTAGVQQYADQHGRSMIDVKYKIIYFACQSDDEHQAAVGLLRFGAGEVFLSAEQQEAVRPAVVCANFESIETEWDRNRTD